MKKSTAKKNWIMIAAIFAIAFVVFNLLVFIIVNKKNGVFWTSYIFMCMAFIIQIVSTMLALRTLETETVFMGIPLVSLSLYYFFAAIFVGAVFMYFQNAPLKLALVLQILIVSIYLIVAILALMSRNVIQDVNDEVRESVAAIKTLNVEIDALMSQVNNSELKQALKKVSETIKYSDPMSNAAVGDIEDRIMKAANELSNYIRTEENNAAIQACKDIEALFLQRNNLLKVTK